MKLSFTALTGLVLVLATLPAYSQDILNGDFSAGGGPTTFTGFNYGGQSAAEDWLVWNNTYGTTTTERIPRGIHVTSTAGSNGIYQFLSEAYNPGTVRADCWIFVKTGQAAMWVGNNATGYSELVDITPGKWVHLSAVNALFTNEVAIYSYGAGPSDFYVYYASLESLIEE